MDVILANATWRYALLYPNNTVMCSKAPKRHSEHARQVLKLLRRADVTLEHKKCSFFTNTIVYLGRAKRLRRLEITFHTADMIKHLQHHVTQRGCAD